MDFSEEEIERRAGRVADRLMASGLPLTDKLVRSAARLEAERLIEEAEEAEIERDRAFRQRIGHIQHESRVRDREIRREGAVFGVIAGVLGALVFGALCWMRIRGGDWGMSVVMAVGSLAFLGLTTLAVMRFFVQDEREGKF